MHTLHRYPVFDGETISWMTDSTVEKHGWLVCLRERRNVKATPVYRASCSEIGDDIWGRVDVYDKDSLVVKCDMDACNKGAAGLFGGYVDQFVLTTNVCDAGWQITNHDEFTITFHAQNQHEEGRFQIEPHRERETFDHEHAA